METSSKSHKRSSSKESVMTTSTVRSENYGDKANNKLYDVFNQFDKGQINVDNFIAKIENDVGIPATPEFVSYIRTEKMGKCNYSKVAQSLNYKKDPKANSSYNPPVNPYDQKFHVGQAQKPGKKGVTQNAFQDQMSKALTDYTKGSSNANNFRASLMEYNVPIDARMDALIRKHEGGDFVSYNEFGKHIFKQLNGTEFYNRVDKVNCNNVKIVSPEKTGKGHFKLADEIKQPKSRQIDDHHVEQQERHVGQTYVPVKGKSNVKGINQLHSSIGGILKIDDNRGVAKPHEDFSSPAKKVDLRDRIGNDIFNFSGQNESEGNYSGKKKNYDHQSSKNNGNVVTWD